MLRKVSGATAVAMAIAIAPASHGFWQEDVLGLAAGLSTKSAELQKVQDDLQNRREEVKKEAAQVRNEEQKVEQLKAQANGGVRVRVKGDRIITANGETFLHFIERRSRTFGSYEEAVAEMKRFDLEPSYTGIEITDLATGKVLTEPPPPPDSSALNAANAALANRQSSYDQKKKSYFDSKAAYDKNLADYNASVAKVNQGLPAALQELGQPIPSEADMAAPKGDYQVEDLGELARTYRGQATKDGTAASFVKEAAKLPEPSQWGQGDKVAGAKLRPGTPIATFQANGTFSSGPGSHAAIYVSQNPKGIWVYDQYKTATGQQKPVEARFIRSKTGTSGSGNPSNNANAYFVIKKKASNTPPDLPAPRPRR